MLQEKLVDGRLCYRENNSEEWIPYSSEVLSILLLKAREELQEEKNKGSWTLSTPYISMGGTTTVEDTNNDNGFVEHCEITCGGC